MRYLVVMLLALVAGAVTYLVSMRMGEEEYVAIGFEPGPPVPEEPSGAPGPPPGYTYLQVALTDGPSMRERLQGLLGSLALIAVAMMAMAGAMYGAGVVIGRLIRSFLGEEDGGAPIP